MQLLVYASWNCTCDVLCACSHAVSNREIRDLEQLYNATGEYPAVNQIEDSPQWHTDELMAWCKAHGIKVEAYAPLANFPHRSSLLQDPQLGPIAAPSTASRRPPSRCATSCRRART